MLSMDLVADFKNKMLLVNIYVGFMLDHSLIQQDIFLSLTVLCLCLQLHGVPLQFQLSAS